MAPSLTLVLPVHNAEASLPRQVEELLNIAGELTPRFELLVIDDGSVDDTFEIASELAIRFPQIRVTRHAHHRGLGPTLRGLRARVKSDVVIVHDGVTPLDAAQVRRMWDKETGQQIRLDRRQVASSLETSESELRTPARIHPALAAAHRRLGRLELLPEEQPDGASPFLQLAANPEKPPSALPSGEPGLGLIPLLPAAGFFGAVTDFALGE